LSKPYQKANIPGPEVGVPVFDPLALASIIKNANNILVVIGAESIKSIIGKKTYTEFLLELARKVKATIITTTTAYKFLSEKTSVEDVTIMSLINIINRLKDPAWSNLLGKGNKYDLVIFGGFLVYYVSQSLSTLKNYTEYRTVSLDRFHHPNARFSLPNLEKDEWAQYLEVLLSKL
jgi:acetyl-CoA decarbonylase/synthase complex subunit epsilon